MKKLSPYALLAILAVLAGCGTTPTAPDGVTPARAPTQSELPTRVDWPAGQRFRVDRARSRLRLIVYPEGTMAHLGHPHVIGGPVIDGRIVLAEPFQNSRLSLHIAVNDLSVDRPEWRAAEGFEPKVDDDAVAGTRGNMLSPERLDAATHPSIRIESVAVSGPRWQPDIEALVTLAGRTRQLTVPVALEIEADRLLATGRFVIRQSDFGIEPFRTAGGALRVSDAVLIRFRISATTEP